MLVLLVACLSGVAVGFLLLRAVPLAASLRATDGASPQVSVIIPARNEEANLPTLLQSLRHANPCEVLVVDDGSTDSTAAIAVCHGARVLTSAPLPPGWTGKTWACHQGALAATAGILFFLDADTWFVDSGYRRAIEAFVSLPPQAALSLLPFHRMQRWYEELSLFFNILMAVGAGGFGGLTRPSLFGQSLLIRRDVYTRAGGHEGVRREILENLHFAARVQSAGGQTYTLGGCGALETRMFPDGLAQLRESWRKAFATGAGATAPPVLALSIYWLGAAMLTFLLLLLAHGPFWIAAAAIYVLYAAQIAWFARQLGTFRWTTAALYPIPLVFYFVIFGQSAWLQTLGRPVTWRGRQV